MCGPFKDSDIIFGPAMHIGWTLLSPVTTGGFGGLTPEMEYETLNQWSFGRILVCQAPLASLHKRNRGLKLRQKQTKAWSVGQVQGDPNKTEPIKILLNPTKIQ